MLIDGLVSVDTTQLDQICDTLESAYSCGSTVFVCGNGGSAAISDHFTCDHQKGVHYDTGLLPQVHSLASNMSLITAIANDIGYEDVFSYQLESVANEGDVLVAISASGNSPNIIKAIKQAKSMGVKTIAFCGFTGGIIRDLSDMYVHVNSNNYGVVEDAHQSIMHIVAQTIRKNLTRNSNIKL